MFVNYNRKGTVDEKYVNKNSNNNLKINLIVIQIER